MLDRTIAPAFERSTHFPLVKPNEYALSNGGKLHVLNGGTQEVIRLELIVPAGKWYEPGVGVSYFTASQLDKGTTSKSSFQLASLFDAYGAHVEVTPGNDFITITVYALTRNVIEVLAVILEMILDPVFSEEELTLAKSIALQNLRVNEEKTAFVAGKFFRQSLFGVHPYGNELNAESIEGIESKMLIAYHRQQLTQFYAIASGNVSGALTNQLVALLSQLPAKSVPAKSATQDFPKPQNAYHPKEGSVQTTIRYGRRIINRQHTDFFDLLFLTHLLGGYFGSRLMKNIREEKGLTYGIYASLQPLVNDAFFVIGADVNRENRNLTLDEIRFELKKLCTESVSLNELETARNHFIGSLQSEVTTAFAHGDKFKTILLNNLEHDYYQHMITRIDRLTANDLQRIANQYLDTSLFTEVSVG